MNTEIASRVKQRFAEIMLVDPAAVDLDANVAEAYGITSLDALRLMSELEVEYGIDISEKEIAGIRTLADIVQLCRAKRGTDSEKA